MDKKKLNELTLLALGITFSAGKRILDIYEKTFNIDYKTDGSPLTEADKASHEIINESLKISGLPLLSEEGRDIPYEERKNWGYYWLVDPLDGTKEFIKRNGEFTVNIALMKDNNPLSGIIYQPAKGVAYVGIVNDGLYKFFDGDEQILNDQSKLQNKISQEENKIKIIASRTHNSLETDRFIDDLRTGNKTIEILNAGSSLKFCLLAEGAADIYPRFAPTMEWDTAAGQAILNSVGKNIFLYPHGDEMKYNKPNLINEWFIAK